MKNWNVYALSIATTAAVVYTLCAIFDALAPPYGLTWARVTYSNRRPSRTDATACAAS